MITVRRKKLREYYSNSLNLPADLTETVPSAYYTNRQFLNRYTFVFLVAILPILLSGFSRASFVVAVATMIFLAVEYFRTKRITESISLKRTADSTAYEKGQLNVNYEIINRSAFEISGLVFSDIFTGSNEPCETFVVDDHIKPFSTLKFSIKRVCNGGMGEHYHCPMQVKVSDPLGFFSFIVSESDVATTKVLPAIQPIPELGIRGSNSSTSYGLYDVSERGISVNFLSLREYKPGDPLKQISWRLSLKHATPLIKEFERVVNTQITLILDFDPNLHAGEGSDSTWEWAKDIALSLAAQQVTYGNDIQVITQSEFVEFGRGDEHVQFLALRLMNLRPGPETRTTSTTLVEKYLEFIPRGSTVFYIGPGYTFETSSSLKSLPKLRMHGIEVNCILLDGASFTLGKLFGSILHATGTIWTKQKLKETLPFLAKADIPVYLVQMQKKFAKALTKRVA